MPQSTVRYGDKHCCIATPHAPLTAGAGDTEQSRPSSSGGRLEQHLGAVESVELSSPAAALVPSVPVASRSIGFPAGPRVTAAAVPTANHSRIARGVPVEGSGRGVGGEGKANGVTPTDIPRAFKGGSSGGASFGSSSSRPVVVDEQQQLHAKKASDTGQRSVGRRRVRDRKGGGRRRSTDISPAQSVGAESNSSSLAKGGRAGRGKADGARTRPRQMAPQVSFGGSGGGGSGGDRGGGDRGEEAGDKAGQADTGVEANKFRMQAGQSNILVAVRLRPLLKHDREHVEVAKVCTDIGQVAKVYTAVTRWRQLCFSYSGLLQPTFSGVLRNHIASPFFL